MNTSLLFRSRLKWGDHDKLYTSDSKNVIYFQLFFILFDCLCWRVYREPDWYCIQGWYCMKWLTIILMTVSINTFIFLLKTSFKNLLWALIIAGISRQIYNTNTNIINPCFIFKLRPCKLINFKNYKINRIPTSMKYLLSTLRSDTRERIHSHG